LETGHLCEPVDRVFPAQQRVNLPEVVDRKPLDPVARHEAIGVEPGVLVMDEELAAPYAAEFGPNQHRKTHQSSTGTSIC
jgi:hypothetical protein